jgi:Holliday junction resolvasome RuvABC DNA-binding subunit
MIFKKQRSSFPNIKKVSELNPSYSILHSGGINYKIQFPQNINAEINNLAANYLNEQLEIAFTNQVQIYNESAQSL